MNSYDHGQSTNILKNLRNPNQLIDLHLFIVPLELWLDRYRTAYNNAVLESISAGFIRIPASTSLHLIREAINEQLGHEIIPNHFIYLRSVGRCLAVVNKSQEHKLKGNDFLPPLVYSPEIFILPCTHEEALSGTKHQYEPVDNIKLMSGLSNDSNEDYALMFSPRDSVSEFLPKKNSLKSPVGKTGEHDGKIGEHDGNNNGPMASLSNQVEISVESQIQHSATPNDNNENEITKPDIESANDNQEEPTDVGIHLVSESETMLLNPVVQFMKPEIALIPATPEQNSPLPSARVITRSRSRMQDSDSVSSPRKRGSSFGVSSEVLPLTLKKHESREEKVLRYGNHEKKGGKKKLINKEYVKKNQNNKNEDKEKNDPDHDTRLLSLEAKMRQRYEKEKERLEKEHESEGYHNEVKDEESFISKFEELCRNSMTDDQFGMNLEPENEKEGCERTQRDDDNNKLVGFDEQEEDASNFDGDDELSELSEKNNGNTISDKIEKNDEHLQKENVRPNIENRSFKTPVPVYDDDEFTAKLKEIEELKKQNNETRRKNEVKEKEKLQKKMGDLEQRKLKVQELKKQLEQTRAEKHNFQKQREVLVKRSRNLQAEVSSKITQKNNAWRKKFVEERKQTTILEEELKRTKNLVEGQHRKLFSFVGPTGGLGKNKDHVTNGGVPSERSNQRNLVLRFQLENEDLKQRIEVMNKKLIVETKMEGAAMQDLKDIRDKAMEFKINASRSKKTLST